MTSICDSADGLIAPIAMSGTVGAAVAAVLLARRTIRDYRRWRRLGEGGVPSNPAGYLISTSLRLFTREPYSSKPYVRMESDSDNIRELAALHRRRGTRPTVNTDPIPQRQLDQLCPALITRTHAIFDAAIASRPWLGWERSGFEHHHDALTARTPGEHIAVTRRTSGEIAHLHPGDGSMHMVFSGRDAAQIVEKGWGERHGLAGRGPLPVTYLLIYAPRDTEELTVVEQLLDASLAHMGQASTTRGR